MIDGRRRAENNSSHFMGSHRVEEICGAGDVVQVIVQRTRNRIGHRLQSCEVNDGIDGTLLEQSIQSAAILYVAFDERRSLARDLRDALDNHRRAVAEVVEKNSVETSID